MSEISSEGLAVAVHPNGNRLAALEAENAALAAKNAQLQTALESRIVIEQAKGAVSARLGITPQIAFEMVRRLARSQRRNLHEYAAEVVANAGRLGT
jgi:AmiR/NasT family two-component response regulator